MKNNYRIFYFLTILPMIVTIIMLFSLPDRVSIHYDTHFNVDGWGSKYTLLVTPIIMILMSLFFQAFASRFRKEDKELRAKNLPARNEKGIVIIGIAFMIVFNAVAYFYLSKTYYISKQITNPFEEDIYSVLGILMGIAFVIVGIVLPKCKLNSIFGIRTTWSMANEKAWFLTHRMGGVSLIITGIITILGCLLFFQELAAIIFPSICISVSLLWCIIYSKIAYTKSMKL